MLTVANVVSKTAVGKAGKRGYRFDPGMNRWLQDDRMAGKENVTVVQPKTGIAYTVWPVMHGELTARGLPMVPPAEAQKLQKKGWTILDVRMPDAYEWDHIAGSVNVPLFRLVQGKSNFDNVKRLAMFFFNMKATERNPDFVQEVQKKFNKNTKLILACDIGGTLSTKVEVKHKVKTYEVKDPERAFGRESRSLKAAYELQEAGYKQLKHLELGVQQWRHEDFPMEDADGPIV